MSTPTITPPPYEGAIPDFSIYDLMAEMKNLNNVIFVEVAEKEGDQILTFVKNGTTLFHGDMCYLHDYTAHSVKQFFAIMNGDAWEKTAHYGIERIGHPDLPPIRIRDQKWLRW